MLSEVLPDRTQCRRPGEVSDERHNQVVLLDLLQREEIFFRRQIAALLATLVGIDHELFIGRQDSYGRRADGKRHIAVSQIGTADEKGSEHVCDAGLIVTRQLESVLLQEAVFDRDEVLVEHL